MACRPSPLPLPPPTPTDPAATLRIGLTSSAAGLADLVSDPYAQQSGRASLQFVVGNATTLLHDLDDGQLDAVLVHYLPPGDPHWFSPVALDGLVIVVHPDNPVSGLTRPQAQAIFSGRITNWAAVGGPDRPIIIVGREKEAGARAIFTERILAGQPLAVTALVQAGQPAVLEAVAHDPAAVGYAMMGSAAGVKAVAVDGIEATPATTASQTYPLTVPLYFAAPAEPQGELRAFLAWLQSDEGQAILGVNFGRVR
ncbi:MAG: substrate-binding domain-containing protein [Chloroflexota bacterium]